MEPTEDELTLDMIPNGIYRKIAEDIGVDNILKLSKLIGGTRFYFPKEESFLRPIRNLQIQREFTGYNQVVLAQKYNMSEEWVRQICKDIPSEEQLSFFSLSE